jgi:hypothetical protein
VGSNVTSGETKGFTSTNGSLTSTGAAPGWGTSTNLFSGGAYVDLSTGVPAVSYQIPVVLSASAVLDTANVLTVGASSTSVVAARVIKFVG